MWPGPELEALCAEHELSRDDFRDERPGDEIVLRVERESDGRLVPVNYPDTPAIKVMRREMQFINDTLRAAQIDVIADRMPLLTDPMKRKLRRMFKLRPGQRIGEAFEEGGRLAGGFWLDPGFGGEARQNGILIDRQPLAEIDVGQSGLCVLYGITGVAAQRPDGDLYSGIAVGGSEHVRDAVKRFVGALMNIAADDWETLVKLTGLQRPSLGAASMMRATP